MQTSKPSLAAGGACTGIFLEGSTASLGHPIAYIAIPVSGPSQEPQTVPATPQPVWRPPSPPTKQRHQAHLVAGLTERMQKAIGGLGAAQIVTGLISITAESFLYTHVHRYLGVYVGIWCGVLYFVTGVIAARAATTRQFKLVIATMVMSIFSAMFFGCQLGLSAVIIRYEIGSYYMYRDDDWDTLNKTVHALEIALSLLELIFSIACSACCCRAVCRRGCCFCCFDVMAYQNPTPVAASMTELK